MNLGIVGIHHGALFPFAFSSFLFSLSYLFIYFIFLVGVMRTCQTCLPTFSILGNEVFS